MAKHSSFPSHFPSQGFSTPCNYTAKIKGVSQTSESPESRAGLTSPTPTCSSLTPWEVFPFYLSCQDIQGCGQLQDAWICCRGMCCASIPSGSGLGLPQRGFKELQSQDHTSRCSFTSPGSITTQSQEQPILHGTSSWSCWILLKHPHFPTIPAMLCSVTHIPTKNPKIHQQTTTLDTLGRHRGFAEPLKAPGRFSMGSNGTTGRAEPRRWAHGAPGPDLT